MEIKNFVITGFGRSGTNFLSDVMNKSKKWTVLHEPRGAKDELYHDSTKYFNKQIQPSFNTQNYGEVNSYLRFNFEKIKTDKKGILLRNPLNIFLSVMNRKDYINKYKSFVDQIDFWYNEFERLLKNDKTIEPIVFEKITMDSYFLEEVLNKFNVYDVRMLDTNKKINSNKIIKFSNFESLPIKVQQYAKNKLEKHADIINKI